MNYYERHIGDYAKNAGHLSMLEHGAYTLLLDRYYSTEKGIPADQVYKVTHAHTKQERAAVDSVLNEFFELKDGIWTKNRCEEEIAAARARIATARKNGKKGGRPRKETQEKPSGLPEKTQRVISGFVSGSENKTQEKALQTPDTNLNSKSGFAAQPVDPRKQLFDLGKAILGANSGGLISQAIKRTDEATVGSVLGQMAVKPMADPRAYFVAATTPKERRAVV